MISLFQSDATPGVFGFTRDTTGQNLPSRFAPWRRNQQASSLFLGVGESLAQVGIGDPVIRAVDAQGFYLVGAPSRQVRYRHW